MTLTVDRQEMSPRARSAQHAPAAGVRARSNRQDCIQCMQYWELIGEGMLMTGKTDTTYFCFAPELEPSGNKIPEASMPVY